MGAVAASLGAALPALRQHFDVGAAQGGSLVSLFNLGSLAVIGVCGFGQRRLKPRGTITVVAGAFVARGVVIFLPPSWGVLQVAGFGPGGGGGGPGPSLDTPLAPRVRG